MTTVVLNRSLLRLRRAKILDRDTHVRGKITVGDPLAGPRSLSPFNARPRLEADNLLERSELVERHIDKGTKMCSPSRLNARELNI